MPYCLIGLQTNSVKPHMLSFMTTAVQFLFPTFLGAFGGLWVVSNVSLEITDCRGRVLTLPLGPLPSMYQMGTCSDRQNTNPEMHTWKTRGRKVEGDIIFVQGLFCMICRPQNSSLTACQPWMLCGLYSFGIHGVLVAIKTRTSLVFERFLLYISHFTRRAACYSWSNNEISL